MFFTILDEHHLIVVTADEATTLKVYRMDPTRASPPELVADIEPSMIRKLSLPALAPEYVICGEVATHCRRASFPDCTPPFESDLTPTHAFVAVPYSISTEFLLDCHSAKRDIGLPPSCLLLIPAQAIIAEAEARRPGNVALGEEALAVPWKEWGPTSTITLALARHLSAVSVCGYRALLLFRYYDTEASPGYLEFLTVDVPPHSYAARRDSYGEEENIYAAEEAKNITRLLLPQEEVYARKGGGTTSSGRSRLGGHPWRIRYKKVDIGEPLGGALLGICDTVPLIIFTDDTFGFPVSCEFESSRRS